MANAPFEITRLTLCVTAVLCASFAGCAARAGTDSPTTPEAPQPVVSTSEDLLPRIGEMYAAHVLSLHSDGELLFDVEPIRGGRGDLPEDLGPMVIGALNRIGDPFRARRAWIDLNAHTSVPLADPPPQFRIAGAVVGYQEIKKTGRDRTASTLVKELDGMTRVERGDTVTVVTLAMRVENPNGVAVPGAAIEYRVFLVRRTKGTNLAVYIAGNGFGLGSLQTTSQNAADAMREAIERSLVHLLAHTFMLPYEGLSSVFTHDRALEQKFRAVLRRSTDAELVARVGHYMFLAGHDVEPGAALDSPRNWEALMAALKAHGLTPEQPEALTTLAYELWAQLDYVAAARRTRAAIDNAIKRERQKDEVAQREVVAVPDLRASLYGWTDTAAVVTVDMSKLANVRVKDRLVKALRLWRGASRVRTNAENTLVGVRWSGQPATLQAAIRRTRMKLRFVWQRDAQQREYLVVTDDM